MATTKQADVTVLTTDLKGFRGDAQLIKVGGAHFVISAIDNEFGAETLAFASDERSEIEDWTDRAAVHGMNHEACIAALLENLSEDAA